MQHDASEISARVNQEVFELLDFNDQRELENARRGLLTPVNKLEITMEDGHRIWQVDPRLYEGDAPNTANPSLWRHTQMNALHGFFEVCEGIYQVRGYDMANLTLIRSNSGYMVYDCTMCTETARAALALAREVLSNLATRQSPEHGAMHT